MELTGGSVTTFSSGREPLAGRVARELRERILRGELAAGARLTEVWLAAELDVSRTPVREALVMLSGEGFVAAGAGRGYCVLPLSATEVRELFAVVAEQEILALQWAGAPDGDVLGRMAECNARLAAVERDAEAALRHNGDWHRLLYARCANAELCRIIDELRIRIYRYEYHYFAAGPAHTARAADLHRDIMEPLTRGDLAEATQAIRRHWWTDLDEMLPRVV